MHMDTLNKHFICFVNMKQMKHIDHKKMEGKLGHLWQVIDIHCLLWQCCLLAHDLKVGGSPLIGFFAFLHYAPHVTTNHFSNNVFAYLQPNN